MKVGLSIRSSPDENAYPLSRKVIYEELVSLSIEWDTFHGEWNDTLSPRAQNT